MEDRYIPLYFFNDTDEKNKKLFGEKGTRLLGMTKKGSHVPTGFIVTSASVYYFLIIKKNYFNF